MASIGSTPSAQSPKVEQFLKPCKLVQERQSDAFRLVILGYGMA